MLKLSYSDDPSTECGVDEAGAGPLMGPVVAAAVVWTSKDREGIRDSKKLSEKKRATLAQKIRDNALDYAIASVDEATVDSINPLEARILAMHMAISQLSQSPKLIIVDGDRFRDYHTAEFDDEISEDGKKCDFSRGHYVPHHLVVKGDDIYTSIAAASILAKTTRDEIVLELHKEYPMYGWDRNKGYGTKEHRDAISKYGLTPYHRKTFVH